jgi:hypothetical protein
MMTVAPPTPIRLVFHDGIRDPIRARIDYAFRVFAAIYNYKVVDSAQALTVVYGGPPTVQAVDGLRVRIPARYSSLAKYDPTGKLVKIHFSNEDFFLFHGLDPITRQPDWLGEIFEWLSGGWEQSITTRDSVGRVPDGQMIFKRLGLDPRKPQAALYMAWLDHFLHHGSSGGEGLRRAPSPVDSADHLVVCSHDVDFYYTGQADIYLRLIKNLGISCLLYRDADYFFTNVAMLARTLQGRWLGNYIPPLISRLKSIGCGSTFFVVPTREHRRDPNYKLSDLLSAIRFADQELYPVELHASYTSMLEKQSLLPERAALEGLTKRRVSGSRQHWLRFADQQQLFQAVESACLLFDSSVGFTDTVGFRNGACFAFPPYHLREERPFQFLEIPLAIMDGSLIEAARNLGNTPQQIADSVLMESRKLGWGGTSILWHNPIEPISVPDQINRVFWECAEKRHTFREEWVNSDEFLRACLSRFHEAGLLTHTKIVATKAHPDPASLQLQPETSRGQPSTA